MEEVRCPICLTPKAEHPALVDRTLAVTYCPECGIPHFMEPAVHPEHTLPDKVRCEVCGKSFKPENGGGPVLRYYMNPPITFQTPHGIQVFTLTRG